MYCSLEKNHLSIGAALVSKLSDGLQDLYDRRCSDVQQRVKLRTVWYHFIKLLPRKFVKTLNTLERLQEQSDLTD